VDLIHVRQDTARTVFKNLYNATRFAKWRLPSVRNTSTANFILLHLTTLTASGIEYKLSMGRILVQGLLKNI
jgi:hypothetical protein